MATKREKIMLASTGKTQNGDDTGYFYTVPKPSKKAVQAKKLEVKKYDPRAWNEETKRRGMHVTFKEKKIPK